MWISKFNITNKDSLSKITTIIGNYVKSNPKPSAKVKDTKNLGNLQLCSHQAHDQAIVITSNLTLASNDTLSNGNPAPETISVNKIKMSFYMFIL